MRTIFLWWSGGVEAEARSCKPRGSRKETQPTLQRARIRDGAGAIFLQAAATLNGVGLPVGNRFGESCFICGGCRAVHPPTPPAFSPSLPCCSPSLLLFTEGAHFLSQSCGLAACDCHVADFMQAPMASEFRRSLPMVALNSDAQFGLRLSSSRSCNGT